ncbi:hypothetical protein [Bradyrhizobium sp. LTSP857]|uniref:hypothetical protein n=1 Tax=Bradyrhizobium sp. LTSP857 TaxID=1619231 RepID=UPI0018CEF14E|nr:hypothetical protein [Bradyrhizobium sp. LTSP857]
MGRLRGLFFKEGSESDAANVSDRSRRQHDGMDVSREVQLRIQLSSPGSTGRSSIPETAVIEPRGCGVLDAPVKPGHDSGDWRDKTPNRHHAILPLFCPTEQMIVLLFPNSKRSMISA